MDPQSRQEALNNISDEDLEKIKERQASTSGAMPVDNEWMLLTEFAKAFGWQAYLDAKNDARDNEGNLIVTTTEMLTLIEANRKLEATKRLNDSHSVLIGSMSAQSKKPSNTFKRLTKDIIKQTKVQE